MPPAPSLAVAAAARHRMGAHRRRSARIATVATVYAGGDRRGDRRGLRRRQPCGEGEGVGAGGELRLDARMED